MSLSGRPLLLSSASPLLWLALALQDSTSPQSASVPKGPSTDISLDSTPDTRELPRLPAEWSEQRGEGRQQLPLGPPLSLLPAEGGRRSSSGESSMNDSR